MRMYAFACLDILLYRVSFSPIMSLILHTIYTTENSEFAYAWIWENVKLLFGAIHVCPLFFRKY